MPRFTPLFKKPLCVCIVLAMCAVWPQQARADFSGEMLLQLTNLLSAIRYMSVIGNRGQDILATQDRRIADYNAKTQSELLKQQSKVDALQNFQPPSDASCAVATLSQSDVARRVKGDNAIAKVTSALATTLYTTPDSGNQIYQKRVFDAACKMGAIGSSDTERHGKACDTAADANLKDRDISLSRMLSDYCIPFDPDKITQELPRMLTQDNYSASDANMKEAMLTMLLIHRFSRIDQESFPKSDTFKTSLGLYKATLMTDSIARRFSGQHAVLRALDYHACYSKTYLPECQKGDAEARAEISEAKLDSVLDMPPSGYCLSQWQIDIAKQLVYEKLQKKYFQGTDAQSVTANMTIENASIARYAHTDVINAAASLSVNPKNAELSDTRAVRPVSDSGGSP